MDARALVNFARRARKSKYAQGVPLSAQRFAAAQRAGLVEGELQDDGTYLAHLTTQGQAALAKIAVNPRTNEVTDERGQLLAPGRTIKRKRG